MPSLVPRSVQLRHPELFLQDAHIDRRTYTRQVPMQVLALGFSRTGTASMCAALHVLGYPTYHFFRIFTSVRDADMWAEAYEAKYFGGDATLDRSFFDKLLGHVSAVTDAPAIGFARELIAAYPEAKVILWERDEQTWLESFEEGVISTYKSRVAQLLAWLDPQWWGRIHRIIYGGMCKGTFGANDQNELRRNSLRVYRAHFATIRELMQDRPGELLEYKMGDGWEPICKFLGEPVPAEVFPRINDRAAVRAMGLAVWLKILDNSIWRLLALTIALMAAIFLASSLHKGH